MKENRALAKVFAGLLIAGTVAIGAATPAQARDTGWNGTIAPAHDTVVTKVSKPDYRDTGWNGT